MASDVMNEEPEIEDVRVEETPLELTTEPPSRIAFAPKYVTTNDELRVVVLKRIKELELEQAEDECVLFEMGFVQVPGSEAQNELASRIAMRQVRIQKLAEAHDNQFGDM